MSKTHKTVKLNTLINIYFSAYSGYLYNGVNKALRKKYTEFFESIGSELKHEDFMDTNAVLTDYEDAYKKTEEKIRETILENTEQKAILDLDFNVPRNVFNVISEINKESGLFVDEEYAISELDYDVFQNMFLEAYSYIQERWAFTIQRKPVLDLIDEEHHKVFEELQYKMNMKRITGNTDYSVHLVTENMNIDNSLLTRNFKMLNRF